MKEPIHYLKSRNSDFLAGVDLEVFALEGKPTYLTVSSVDYKENFKVNGRLKSKGLVMHFKESYAKPLIVNTTNSTLIREYTGVIDATKWVGFTIDFHFDLKVEMKVSKTETKKGGIRVKSVNTNGIVPPVEDIKSRIKNCTNKAEVMSIWNYLSEHEQIEYKQDVTDKYKSLN